VTSGVVVGQGFEASCLGIEIFDSIRRRPIQRFASLQLLLTVRIVWLEAAVQEVASESKRIHLRCCLRSAWALRDLLLCIGTHLDVDGAEYPRAFENPFEPRSRGASNNS